MDIGFITNSLTAVGVQDVVTIAEWAHENGFKTLEIGPSIALDEKKFNQVLTKGDIRFSAFIYCRNFLSTVPEEAEMYKRDLVARMQMAKKIGVHKIICSTGIGEASFYVGNTAKFNPEASVPAVAELFQYFADEAAKNDVKICYENCPLMGNIAISPYMWDALFDKIGSDNVGLVFDPSHLVWQFIDPYDVIMDYKDRIFHVHGKDCEVEAAKLKRIGILHSFANEKDAVMNPHGDEKTLWWRYRLPGLGDLDWNKIVSRLYEIGYDDTISLEHEDPVWSGSEEKVKQGLVHAKRHIAQFMVIG